MNELIKRRRFESDEINGRTIFTVHDVIEVDSRDLEKRVKIIAYLKGMDLQEVSEKFGISQKNNFLRRLQTGKLSFAEQRKIADILGVKSKNIVILKNGKSYEVMSSRELVNLICDEMGIANADIAYSLGITRQALNQRMTSDKFTYEDLSKIAYFAGATYSNYFEFDGVKL